MTADRRTRILAAVCGIVAVGLGLATAAATVNGDSVTALVRMQSNEPMAQLAPPGFSFAANGAHYDGVYYYAIARDPLARGEAHNLIDRSAYHYGHPAYGWLAWLVSGGGQPAAVPYALFIVSLLGIGIAAAAASVLAADLGMSPWWGLSVALNPGLLFAISADCAETVALALTLLALLAWMRQRWIVAGVLIALGCFTKEPLFLLPVAFLAFDAWRWLRTHTRPFQPGRRLASACAGPALYVVWLGWTEWVFARLPWSGISQVSFPITGWISTLHDAWGQLAFGDSQVGSVTAPLLIPFGALLIVGLVRAVRLRNPVDAVFVAFALLAFSTNWNVLLFPKDFIRTAALPLALVPFAIGARELRLFRASRSEAPEAA